MLVFPTAFQIRSLLRSKSWETRVAAAEALGALAEKIPWTSVAQLRGRVHAQEGAQEVKREPVRPGAEAREAPESDSGALLSYKT